MATTIHNALSADEWEGFKRAIGPLLGFTREDVKLLREEAESEWNGDAMETGRQLLSLAARIAALLPPE